MPARLSGEGRFGETEDLLVRIGIGEYLDQIFGGIPMSQGEIVRPHALGLSGRDLARFRTEAVETLIETGNTAENRARLVALIRAGQGAPDRRRFRARRHPRGDPRRDAPLRRGRGRAARP